MEVKKNLIKNKINNVNLYNIKEELNLKLDIDNKYISWKKDYDGKNFYNYVNQPNKIGKKFDLIFIDGECRNACLDVSFELLKDDGMIVFDNTSRNIYKNKILSINKSYKVIFLTGPTPYSQTFDETAFIFKIKSN